MRKVGVIPARWGSSRFPGKPLAPIAGRPMIEHVYRRAARAAGLDALVVATDDERIRVAVIDCGGTAVMTRADHPSGTDRVCEAARSLGADLVVNIQGDEPLLDPGMIDELLALAAEPRVEMATLARPLADPAAAADPHRVKVVRDTAGFALYFSRHPIPFDRGAAGREAGRLEHVGIYSYRMETLERLTALEPSPLELAEGLEQLRALEHGIRIRVGLTRRASISVDTPEDLRRVQVALAAREES